MRISFLLIVILCCCAAVALADVTVTSKMSMGAMGMSMGGSTINVYVSGDKARMVSTNDGMPAIAMMKEAPPEAVYITRLDKGEYWIVYDIDSSYAVSTLPEMQQSATDSSSATIPGIAPGDISWDLSAEKLNDSTINGYSCHGVHVHGATKIKGIQQVLEFTAWAADDVPGQSELKAFGKASADATGVDPFNNLEMLGQAAMALGINVETFEGYTEELGGVLIKFSLKVFMKINADMSDQSMETAGVETAEEPEETETAEDSEEGMFATEDDVEAAVDSAMIEKVDAFGKKMQQELTEMMSMTVEVTSITTDDIDPSNFEIPEGYKKF